jgi:hypothetical protein
MPQEMPVWETDGPDRTHAVDAAAGPIDMPNVSMAVSNRIGQISRPILVFSPLNARRGNVGAVTEMERS